MKQVYLAEDTRLANRSCALAEMIDSLADPAERQAAAASSRSDSEYEPPNRYPQGVRATCVW